jgi:hypothetical protein
MNSSTRRARIVGGIIAATLLLGCMAGSQSARSEIRIGTDGIGGTVTSARGAEAGVWVIAETHEFKTRFAKIVVTDGAGRYLLPELPRATYSVWVRGYGLANWRSMTRRAANIHSSIPASAPTICNSPKTRTILSGPAAAAKSSAGSTPRNSI